MPLTPEEMQQALKSAGWLMYEVMPKERDPLEEQLAQALIQLAAELEEARKRTDLLDDFRSQAMYYVSRLERVWDKKPVRDWDEAKEGYRIALNNLRSTPHD